MRSQAGGMPYGGRGSGGGRAPQPAYGGMAVPPPAGPPHYMPGGQQASQVRRRDGEGRGGGRRPRAGVLIGTETSGRG